MSWTMSCPHCKQTLYKDRPQDRFECQECGWKSDRDAHLVQLADLYPCA